MTLEPCRCGQPAVRTLCAYAYCTPCSEAILEPIRKRVLGDESGIGVGRQKGLLRPDWGQNWADLECNICRAGWTGPIGEPCTWCIDRHQVIIEAQRQVALHPDLPHHDNPDREHALILWAERLAHAVKAGLIDERDARHAIRREQARHVA